MTDTNPQQPDRRQTVEYFLQTRQPDDSWESSSSFMDDPDWAKERLATRLEKMPQFDHRVMKRTTSVVVEPIDTAASAPVSPAPAEEQVDRLAQWLWDNCAEDERSGLLADDPRRIALVALRWPELRRMADAASGPGGVAGETPQPETQAALLLSSRCDACRHTLNWHRNDVGCTVALCVCGRFQQPAAVSQPDGEA